MPETQAALEEQNNLAESNTQQEVELSSANNGWERFLDRIRLVTPDVIVNEGGRFNFGLRAIADGLSIKSGLRPAILNDEALHKPFYEANPGKLPNGLAKFEKGMHLGYAAPYRAAGGAVTLGALLMGAYYGEQPLTEEEKQAQSELPIGDFIKKRIRDSFHPSEHATATAGMATIANGALVSVAGLKQFNGFKHNGHYSFKALPFEFVQGLLTMAAGGFLQFIPNQEYAWQLSTSVFLNRTPVAAAQAWKAWDVGIPGKVDPGDWEQGAKFAMNQTSNIFAMLYAGIKKEDGKIIRTKKGSPEEIADVATITNNSDATPDSSNINAEPSEELETKTPTPTVSSAEVSPERLAEEQRVQAAG